MNTFLPYKNFDYSARVLDDKRLNKQIVECQQILQCILQQTKPQAVGLPAITKTGWNAHPAVRMWMDWPESLAEYAEAMNREWERRKRIKFANQGLLYDEKANLHASIAWIRKAVPLNDIPARPWWLGNEDFHRSHQANLLRKDYDHYSQYFDKDLPLQKGYLWPKDHYDRTWERIGEDGESINPDKPVKVHKLNKNQRSGQSAKEERKEKKKLETAPKLTRQERAVLNKERAGDVARNLLEGIL